MKKLGFLIFGFVSVCFLSCDKKNSSGSEVYEVEVVRGEDFYEGSALPVDFNDAFTPDYSIIVPEKATSNRRSFGIDTSSSSVSSSVVPKLRELSDYKIKYNENFDTQAYVEAKIENVPKKSDTKKNDVSDDLDVVKKKFINVLYINPGWTKENPNVYDPSQGLLPNQKQQVHISLTTPLDKNEFLERMEVVAGGNKNVAFDVDVLDVDGNVLSDKDSSSYFLVKFKEKFEPNAEITVRPKGNEERFSWKTFIYLNDFNCVPVSNRARNVEGKNNLYAAHFTHEIDSKSVFSGDVPNMKLKEERGEEISLKKENIEVFGNIIKIFNLPLKENGIYELKFGSEIKDVYGRALKNFNKTHVFYPAIRQSYARYLDSGSKILEAQFPPKLLIEYFNIGNNSYYSVEKAAKDENIFNYKKNDVSSKILLDPKNPNTKYFEEIPLDDYLENGKGFVRFYASAETDYWNSWGKKYEKTTAENSLALQVTDLGVTARIAINKAVVLVTSLETGEPVEGANVELRNLKNDTKFISQGYLFGTGVTDKNGVAVIKIEEKDAKFMNKLRNSYDYEICLYVEKDGDKTLFEPDSHNVWRYNVRSSSVKGTLNPIERTFMFVDRKIYKPGETVTYRGIDRDQLLGKLSTPKGDFEVTLEEGSWNGKKLFTNTGTLSENGGFYGSFRLPDNIKPGTYFIYFERTENKKNNSGYYYNSKFVTITVAEFERVKFQAAVEMPDVAFVAGDSISAKLSASYLAGGSLGGADYKARWFKNPVYYSPETNETKDYTFGPADYYDGRDYFSESNGILSGNGTASISSNTEKISGGKTYRYRLEASVTDASNQRIVASGSALVHPAKFYIGLAKPLGSAGFVNANTKLDFQYILTTPKGEILSNTNPVKNLSYVLSHDEWKMVQEKGSNGKVYTRYNKETVTDDKGKISVSAKGKVSITPKTAGWYTLRVTGEDANGNEAVTDLGFYATGNSKNSWWWAGDSSELKLTPDQSVYNPGDTAKVLLESPLPKGTYLITVEREGIFTEEIRTIENSTDVIDVKIASNYSPVVYLSIASYSVRKGKPTHEYGEPDLDKPKGYYGVTSLKVTNAIKAFSVSIKADKPSYKPGDMATLTLHATKGGRPFKNAELTVMAVDRAVIDLVDYHVDDPIEFFYSSNKFPLRVQGGDNRAYLMDPVTYSIKNLQGGDSDETKDDEEENARKDFRPTALFEPEIKTNENGDATVTFKVPDSLTTYRVTAFGVKDDLFALSEDEIQVRNPINIQQVQPRKLRLGDTAEAGVLITNLGATEENVTVTLEVRAPDGNTADDELNGRITVAGEGFVDGEASATLKVASGSSAPCYFNIGTTKAGTVELVYTIKSDAINEKLISPIKIDQEATYVYETLMETGTIDDTKKKATAQQKIVIPLAANEGEKTALKVTLDTTRLGLLGGAVNYLFDYPHGCMEQQSSRVLPLVIFGDYIDVFGLDSKVSKPKKVAVSFMKKWKDSQLPDGGFPYWPSGTQSDVYVSTRLLHIAALVKQRGYSDREIGFDVEKLKNYVKAYTEKNPDGYRLYVLALAGIDTSKDAKEMFESETEKKVSLYNMSYLALASLYSGDKATAEKIGKHLKNYLDTSKRSVAIKQDPNAKGYWWYEGDASLMANLLQLYVSLDRENEISDLLIFSILQSQKKGYWHNTAETARVLEAIYTMIKARNLDETKLDATASIDGNKVAEGSFKGAGAKPITLTIPLNEGFMAKLPREKEIGVDFEKDGKGHLYYTLEMKYPLPISRQTARNEGIGIKYVIEDFDTGVEVKTKGKDSALMTLEAGKLYRAKVTVSAKRAWDFVAMRAPVPSGAEILDAALSTTGSEAEIKTESSSGRSWKHWLSNKEIYDNEACFYWDDFEEGEATVSFTFRAVRRGVYPTPSVFAECMYEPEVYGRSNAALFVIK